MDWAHQTPEGLLWWFLQVLINNQRVLKPCHCLRGSSLHYTQCIGIEIPLPIIFWDLIFPWHFQFSELLGHVQKQQFNLFPVSHRADTFEQMWWYLGWLLKIFLTQTLCSEQLSHRYSTVHLNTNVIKLQSSHLKRLFHLQNSPFEGEAAVQF